MGALGAVVEVLAVAGSLAAAVVRSRWAPEAAVAVLAAVITVAIGAAPMRAAGREVVDLLPVVGFLVAVLVLGSLLARAGLFAWLGTVVSDRARGDPRRLFTLVFTMAALTTVVLSLDTTVVLLVPVVLATVRRARVGPAPYLLACVHLANSASLLLPVSNLSNLLALSAAHIGFLRFSALMAAPALVAVAVDFLGMRLLWRRRLGSAGARLPPAEQSDRSQPPVFAAVVVILTLLGFLIAGAIDIAPVWPATAGALALAGPALRRGEVTLRTLVRASGWDFAVFVLGLGVVVAGLTAGPVGAAVRGVLPRGSGLLALLGVAVIAAVLANLVNNLPATLLLVGLLGGAAGPLPVLAALIGLNVGPNLTYPGSLATLLWRRLVPAEDRPGLGTFTLAGVMTVPITLVLATVALWAAGLVLT